MYRQHKLQYEPALEELRIRHYKDYLNTFLGLPLRCEQSRGRQGTRAW